MIHTRYRKLPVLFLIVALLVGCAPRMRPGPLPAADVSSRVEQKSLGAAIQLPLYFIANQGQRDARVAYYAQGSGFGLDFATNQVTIGLGETTLHVRFPDAQVTRPAGVKRARAEVNTLVGDDPTRWRTGIPTYGQVVYQDLYPGIDLCTMPDNTVRSSTPWSSHPAQTCPDSGRPLRALMACAWTKRAT